LPEEQERGISIDLGFAEFELPNGKRAGVVDVPGHERFIKNMVAGVTGIDLVILVVAADEGVMPQTREHLDILDLLGLTNGIVAVTKVDLVEPEWVELVCEEVREIIEDTFLAGAPVVPVSAVENRGLEELIRRVEAELERVERRDPTGFARLPIDRSFTVAGFGTVVTGTLVSGVIEAEDQLQLLPLDREVRVRGLQVHGEDVSKAYAGQRVAVNLTGVDVDELSRGEVLLAPNSMEPTRTFASTLELLPHVDWVLENNERVRLHTGTSEILGRILLLDREQLFPGETTFMQFKAESPLVVGRADRCIIRTYSPMRTVAGGEILDTKRRFRRFNEEHLEELELILNGELEELVMLQLRRGEEVPVTVEQLSERLAVPVEELEPVLKSLAAEGSIAAFGSGLYSSTAGQKQLKRRISDRVQEYHERFPLRPGISREELRQSIVEALSARHFERVLEHMEDCGDLRTEREYVASRQFAPQLPQEQAALAKKQLKELEAAPYSPPGALEWLKTAGVEEQEAAELLQFLREKGRLLRLPDGLDFAPTALEGVVEELKSWFSTHETITVSQLRDLLDTSRKYAVPILEYLDQQRVTYRSGDKRILRE
jgi:selenocysteine-specific elongation factor